MGRVVAKLVLAALVVAAAPTHARAATHVVHQGNGTLQAALDAAQDGDEIVLKAGVYRGTFSRNEIANLTIRAQGKVTLDGKGSGNSVLEFRNANGLTVEGLTIKKGGDDGIHLYTSSNVVIRRCKFVRCADSGIEERDTQGYTVEECSFVGCEWGLAIGYDGSSSGVIVRGSRFSGEKAYGIDLWSDDALIEENVFSAGGGVGIRVRDGFSRAHITKNRMTKVGREAIILAGSNHTVTSNTVVKCGRNGIAVGGDGGHQVTDNVVKKGADAGIFVDSTGNTFSRNTASKNHDGDLRSNVAKSENTFDSNVFGKEIYP